MEKLIIYKKSLDLIANIYSLIRNNFELKKDYSLCDQLKRSAISIPLNIAEGYGRGIKHFKSYLKIATGSTNELITILKIIELIYHLKTDLLQNEYQILAKQISSFSRSLNN